MAAAGGGPLRLRLLFDYPPPGSPGCALCWLLVEPSQVRLVTDLVSLIRHRFGFSRRARLSLFLEGALLPPTESARLVRDNDSLRVKLEEIVADEYEENPVEVPKRDYSVLPLLAAPPQVGERIAFKRLELTENYSPEVSDYKEGKIISWNADKKQIELEILSSSAGQLAKEPGKFDLVYQSADGAELIEYAVPQDTKITESWDALIEPRLIVEPPVNGSSVENGTI
ncbi:coilin isoform X2 [Grus americana]|uniref:coilin isoform X2 n=1 Tax=Grus americana TaxID=9117 RepID=UPI0024087DA2|nr:coilin isoform X2 [Grus americana]